MYILNEAYEYDPETAVVIDIKKGEFFELNEIANLILKMLLANYEIDEIRKIIIQEYDVSKNKSYEDITSFINDLISRGVLLFEVDKTQ